MDMVQFGLRLFHILPAVAIAGGVFFMWLALVPALSSLDDATRESLIGAVRGRWAKVIRASVACLLVTGIINAVSEIKAYQFEGPYHALVAVKLLLAIVIMGITEMIGGRSAAAQKARQNMAFWMNINASLVIVLILVAVFMRSTPRTPKGDAAADAEPPTASLHLPIIDQSPIARLTA